LFACFHVSYASHRFGLFSHVFNEFFVQFFVPAYGEKRGISWAILSILDSWPMGIGRIEQFLCGYNDRCRTLFSEQRHGK